MEFLNNISLNTLQPLDPRCVCDTLPNLVSRNTNMFYQNIVVFITTEKKYYVLNDGMSGTLISDWTDLIAANNNSNKFLPYNNLIPYSVGDTVRVGSNFFICTSDTIAGEIPIGSNKFVQLGINSEITFEFNNVNSIDIPNTIVNPIVNVWWYKDISETVLILPYIKNEGININIDFNNNYISGKCVIK